jgi:hypothetical protein
MEEEEEGRSLRRTTRGVVSVHVVVVVDDDIH